jgi:hypothetical protein
LRLNLSKWLSTFIRSFAGMITFQRRSWSKLLLSPNTLSCDSNNLHAGWKLK